MAAPKPDTPSSAYTAMEPYWDMVDAILGGAATMRAAGQKYLPKFQNETAEDYEFRRKNAKFTNVFRDIVENLAAKPFTEEMGVTEDSASPRVTELVEDIDGKGNHLHVFAQSTFFNGISHAITWILVDYTKDVPAQATIADEKAIGARPYWVHIPAKRVIAVYSDIVGGVEILTHVRIREDVVERDGFGEVTFKRVRVFNRAPLAGGGYADATWQLFEEQQGDANVGRIWVEIESGPVTIGVIPLVPFTTGRHCGSPWQLVPSMQDAADLQIELFQQESGLKSIKEATAFPMLSGDGVTPETGPDGFPLPVKLGPKAVLYAVPSGSGGHGISHWGFIEPSATSLRFLADDIKETIQNLRELGRQPLTAQTGNLTVITTAFAAQKGNSAIQAWAINLKDALEKALALTAMWLKEDQRAKVTINTDFDVGLEDDKSQPTLLAMRASGDLSQRTFWHEMRRRGILSPEFDVDTEDERLMDELPGDVEEAPEVGTPQQIPGAPAPGVPAPTRMQGAQ